MYCIFVKANSARGDAAVLVIIRRDGDTSGSATVDDRTLDGSGDGDR